MFVHNHSIKHLKLFNIYRGILFSLCLILSLTLTSCAKKKSTPSNAGIRSTDDGFFEFYGTTDEDMDELERMNKQILDIRDEYQKTLEDENDTWKVTTKLSASDRILQGTIYMTKTHISLLGTEETTRVLASYAFDKRTHQGIDVLNALQAANLTGVDLSRKIDKAFRTLEPNGIVHTTEMQGFLLNDTTGDIQFIYMKVEGDFGGDEYEDHFYLYDPAVDAMQELSWPGSHS